MAILPLNVPGPLFRLSSDPPKGVERARMKSADLLAGPGSVLPWLCDPRQVPALSGPQFICRMGVRMDVNWQPNRAAAKLDGKDPSSPRDTAQVQRLVLCLPLACRTPASPHQLSVKAVILSFSLGHTPSLCTSLWLPSALEKSKLVSTAAKAVPSSAASSPTAQPPQCPVPPESGPCTAWHCPAPHCPVQWPRTLGAVQVGHT